MILEEFGGSALGLTEAAIITQEINRPSRGMPIFIVDLAEVLGKGMAIKPIRNMVGHMTCEVFFDNLEIPAENPTGQNQSIPFPVARASMNIAPTNLTRFEACR